MPCSSTCWLPPTGVARSWPPGCCTPSCTAQHDATPAEIGLVAVGTLLDAVTLVDLTRGDLLTAGGLPGRLRSADAVHLTVALRIGVSEMITYDRELAAAAVLVGLPVGRPA